MLHASDKISSYRSPFVKDIDPRLLRTFETVVAHGSITSAAAALGYVPSAVSQHVARLEAQVGLVLLLTRSRNGVTATAHGEALREAATRVLAGLADLQDRMGQLAGQPPRLSASAAAELLPGALVTLRQRHPGLRVLLREYEPGEGLRALSTGRVDVLLAYNYRPGRSGLSDPAVRVEQVGVEPLLLCAARDSPDPAVVEGTAEADWVAGSAGTPDRLLVGEFHADHHLAPMIVAETDDYNVASRLIAAGLVVGLLPASLVAASGDRLRVLRLAQPPQRQILMLQRAGALSTAGEGLLVALRDRLDRLVDLAREV